MALHLAERVRTRFARLWGHLSGQKRRRRRAAQAAFDAALAALRPGDLAIDLGANLGEVSARLAATGADLVAFEPDPHAFGRLQARLGGLANVTLLPAAAGPKAGVLPLFRHRDFDAAPDRQTLASSLIADHGKVGATAAVQVEVIDFPGWLAALNRDVALLKIDIEGAEVALLEVLLDAPVAGRIGQIFVETHEKVLPGLAARTRVLKARSRGTRNPAINWDWH